MSYGQNCISIFGLVNGCYHEYSILLIFYAHDFFSHWWYHANKSHFMINRKFVVDYTRLQDIIAPTSRLRDVHVQIIVDNEIINKLR